MLVCLFTGLPLTFPLSCRKHFVYMKFECCDFQVIHCIEPVYFTVVNQFYEAEILTEYVIRGNTAVLKCSIPSFVADFVQVEAWIADDGEVHVPSSENYGMLKHDYCKI